MWSKTPPAAGEDPALQAPTAPKPKRPRTLKDCWAKPDVVEVSDGESISSSPSTENDASYGDVYFGLPHMNPHDFVETAFAESLCSIDDPEEQLDLSLYLYPPNFLHLASSTLSLLFSLSLSLSLYFSNKDRQNKVLHSQNVIYII